MIVSKARSNEGTIFNPINHSYFNLSGNHHATIEDHWLQVNSTNFLSVDDDLIPDEYLTFGAGICPEFLESRWIGGNGYHVCYAIENDAVLRHDTSRQKNKGNDLIFRMQL